MSAAVVQSGPALLGERLRTALEAASFDAVLTVSPAGSKHLSGAPLPFQLFYGHRPTAVFWPRQGDPVLFTGADQLAGPQRTSHIADLRGYREHGRPTADVLAEMLAALLAERGLGDGTRIGVEEIFMPVGVHKALAAALPGVELVAADGLLDRLRATKTPEEIALMRELARATELGVLEAFGDARAGWTERQLAARISRRIVEQGAETVPMILCGTGEGARVFGEPTDRRLEPGDLVRIDLNAAMRGYYSDIGRMAVVGEPSPEQEAAYGKHVEINRRVLEAMRPGVRASEVFALEQAVAAELGAELLEQPSIGLGHAIGTHPSDDPKLMASDQTTLEEGMIFNIEPDVIGPLGERIHLEEMVLVTAHGGELLTGNADWSQLPRIEVA